MSLALENTGFCVFGADPDGAQPSANAPAPATLGAKFPPSGARCKVHVKYKGGTKIEKATGAGKGGARQTASGTKVAEATVKIKWADVEPTASIMRDAMATISPHGANKGKAWAWTERDAALFAMGGAMIEDMELETVEGSDEMVLTLKLSGWDKPFNAGAGTGTTPTAAQKYTVPGTPGNGLAGVTFFSKPTVVPNP